MFQQNQRQRETKTYQLLSGPSHIWASLKPLCCCFSSWLWHFQTPVPLCISSLQQNAQGIQSTIKLQRAAPAFSISESSGTEFTCLNCISSAPEKPYRPEAWQIYNKGPERAGTKQGCRRTLPQTSSGTSPELNVSLVLKCIQHFR